MPERAGLAATHTRDVFYGYDLLGNLTYARFDSHSGADGLSFAYNGLGQLTAATQAMDGATRQLSYLYDAAGRRGIPGTLYLGIPGTLYLILAFPLELRVEPLAPLRHRAAGEPDPARSPQLNL